MNNKLLGILRYFYDYKEIWIIILKNPLFWSCVLKVLVFTFCCVFIVSILVGIVVIYCEYINPENKNKKK
jgi:hypothetical protein